MTFFPKKIILKLIWNQEAHGRDKTIQREMRKAGGITLPYVKIYCKAAVTTTGCYWHKMRHVGQWNRNKPVRCSQHLLNQGAKNTHWERVVSNKWCWKK